MVKSTTNIFLLFHFSSSFNANLITSYTYEKQETKEMNLGLITDVILTTLFGTICTKFDNFVRDFCPLLELLTKFVD